MELARALFEAATAGFEGTAVDGVCQFRVTDGRSEEAFCFVVEGGRLTWRSGVTPDPRASVSLPKNRLVMLLDESSDVDFRDPRFLAGIRVDGDLAFVASLGQLVKRPLPATVLRFRHAEASFRGSDRTSPVRRLRHAAPEAVRSAVHGQRPVVVEGGVRDWPFVGASFADLVGSVGHLTMYGIPSAPSGGESVADFLGRTADADVAYTAGCALPAALWSVFRFPGLRANALAAPQLWAGRASAETLVTGLHRDNATGLLAQVIGTKRMRLYSPDQTKLLYAFKAYNHHQPCWVDPVRPDLIAHPLFAQAESVEVVLRPGDLLVTPVGWFHCASIDGPSLSISRFLRRESSDRNGP